MTLGLEPVARSSLSDAVFDQLAQQILTERIEPGEPLPPERELAKALGVNRGAVREGLKRLAQAGLIEQPHTSAGRVPTSSGLRFFIDSLLKVRGLSAK